MRIASFSTRTALKLLVAALAVVALLAWALHDLAPAMSGAQLLLYAAVGVALALVLVAILAIVSAQLAQFVLRKGGTDTQWFWFRREPPGLEKLRKGD